MRQVTITLPQIPGNAFPGNFHYKPLPCRKHTPDCHRRQRLIGFPAFRASTECTRRSCRCPRSFQVPKLGRTMILLGKLNAQAFSTFVQELNSLYVFDTLIRMKVAYWLSRLAGCDLRNVRGTKPLSRVHSYSHERNTKASLLLAFSMLLET